MNPERREAQSRAGAASLNLISTSEGLKLREEWKYTLLRAALQGRDFEFEYAMQDYVFDLALHDVRVLVEFDGPEHGYDNQILKDQQKEAVANVQGYLVVHRRVQPVTVIGVETIQGL